MDMKHTGWMIKSFSAVDNPPTSAPCRVQPWLDLTLTILAPIDVEENGFRKCLMGDYHQRGPFQFSNALDLVPAKFSAVAFKLRQAEAFVYPK